MIGAVALGDESSVWFNAVIRGDNDTITIGARSNIQDGAVLHTDAGIRLAIADEVSIGHLAVLHGCTVGDGCLIGINSVILNRAVIGRECLIGANTLIPEGKVIPDRSLVVGSPGRVVRMVTVEEAAGFHVNARHYVQQARRYLREFASDTRG